MSLPTIALHFLPILAFSSPVAAHQIARRGRFEHDAFQIAQKRQLANVPPAIPAEPTTEPVVLTFVTPSPSATPIAVTEQSQTVTSYVPLITVCALPPLAFISGSYSNPAPTGPPYLNYSVSIPTGSGTCETAYSPIVTPICYSVLDGIGARVTVSDCTQSITFSSDFDFLLDAPETTSTALSLYNSAPYIRPVTTYYIAPWDELVSGQTPDHVEVKVCSTYGNGTTICMNSTELWYTETVTSTTSRTTHVDITTTISGPARVMIETYHMDVTGTETLFALSTHMALAHEYETLTTIRESRSNGVSTTTVTRTSTNTITRGVMYKTPEPELGLASSIG
jgi:hypothetical protein